MPHRIVIVGGGFGGVSAALHLSKKNLKDTEITLISDKPYLAYYGVLYRLLAGKSPSEACIPLAMILKRTKVHVQIDAITTVDPAAKTVGGKSGRSYFYDTLILAPGSESAYFNIPGMEEYALTMKDAQTTLALRVTVEKRIHEMTQADPTKHPMLGRFIVIGAGPSGCEIAGEVLPYARSLARKNGIDPSVIQVDLIEAMDRVLPMVEPKASAKTQTRLEKMGVNVMLKQAVAKADTTGIECKDGKRLDGTTIIWTAGVKAHSLIAAIPGIELDKRGRAMVDECLRTTAHKDIFILGDCAAVQYAGMAQTANEHGIVVAEIIDALLQNKTPPPNKPKEPAYAIPVGMGWAAVKFGPLRVYGFLGYMMRRAADIHVYMLILPWHRIPAVYFGKVSLKRYGIAITA